MILRAVRIVLVVATVALVAAMGAGQVWTVRVQASHAGVMLNPPGVVCLWLPRSAYFCDARRWQDGRRFFVRPEAARVPVARVLLPWWILVVAWLTPAVPLWLLTRPRKAKGGAFPVDPAMETARGPEGLAQDAGEKGKR